MFNSLNKTGYQQGFTLIEVMIVVIIIAIMSTLGMTSYLTFMEENQVKGAAQEVQTFLRDIQNKAKMGDRGAGTPCNASAEIALDYHFEGWRVDFVSGNVSALPLCEGSGGTAEYLALPIAMRAQINSGSGAFTFKSLYSNIEPSGTKTISVYDTRDANIRYCFTIDTGGNIGKVDRC